MAALIFPKIQMRHVSRWAEEAVEAAVRVPGHVLRRRRQQRRFQRLLGMLVQLEERQHPALPAPDGRRGGGPEPLCQLQLV